MKRWKAFAAGGAAVVAFVAIAAAGPLDNSQGADGTAFVVESPPSTACVASGTDSICIGDGGLSGTAADSISIGTAAVASGEDSLALGTNADATGANSIAIGGDSTDGTSADATGTQSIAIGQNSLANQTNALSIGVNSSATQNGVIAIGVAVEATAAQAIAIGYSADATGNNCVAIGGNTTDADSADCTAADAVAIGQHVVADDIGEFAFASGEFTAQSDAHTSIFVLRNQTTDGTQTELFADGSAGDISVPSDCTNIARISIVARQANEDGTNAMYFIVVGHGNDAGTTAELAAPTVTTIFESANASAWDVDTTADDTNDGINVLVTGAASDNINWVARAEIIESCG